MFCVLDDFFPCLKKKGFGVFLVHPTLVLALLSASVERCFVSHMREFIFVLFLAHFVCAQLLNKNIGRTTKKNTVRKSATTKDR